MPIVRELGFYLVPLAHLDWIGLGLLALAGIGALLHYARADRYAYVRDGIPFIARILCRKYVIQGREARTFSFLAGVDFRHPETGRIQTAWIGSDPLNAAFGKAERYQPVYHVGDYVTAVYLPGKFEKTARIYSLLGLNPDIGYIEKDGQPWQPGLSFFVAMCIVLGFVAAFAAVIGGMYALEFRGPIDISGHDLVTRFVPAGIILGIPFGIGMIRLSRYEQRKSGSPTGKPTRPALLWFCGIFLGFLAGAILLIIGNAALDSSPPEFRDVEVVNFWQTTHHGILRQYDIEFTQLGSTKKDRYPARPEYMDKFRPFEAGVIEVHRGRLGMPWIRQIYPVDLREIEGTTAAAHSFLAGQTDRRTGEVRSVKLGLVVVLESGKTMPASHQLWQLVCEKMRREGVLPTDSAPSIGTSK
jgi:hypothetical protein